MLIFYQNGQNQFMTGIRDLDRSRAVLKVYIPKRKRNGYRLSSIITSFNRSPMLWKCL